MKQNLKISLQPFNKQKDFALLEKWIKSPHVKEWWGDPVKNIQEMSDPAIGGGEALIKVHSRPVGYVRWQIPSREDLQAAGLDDLPNSVVDIDIAIGEESYLSQGIGSQALQLLINRIAKSENVPMIMMCTSIHNARAIKSFEKAGFTRDRIFTDPEHGDMWLLTVTL
ncbi:MAG: GNAT family N-acetyltransferase [Calditrichaeota bacterium]|nr:MAG: GNAT family N-acetyltransferase [Calditrichota bacterium]